MDRDLAEKYAQHYQAFGEWFNAMTELSLQLGDEQAGKDMRRVLGTIWSMVDDLLHVPASRAHPDLFPDPDID